jgi:hypothetical protein
MTDKIEQPLMTASERITIFRDKINAAVDAHIAAGGIIISNAFGWGTKECCPLGALVGVEYNINMLYPGQVAQKLGFYFTESDLWDFIYAFDGVDDMHPTNIELHKIGAELRARLNPKCPEQWQVFFQGQP